MLLRKNGTAQQAAIDAETQKESGMSGGAGSKADGTPHQLAQIDIL